MRYEKLEADFVDRDFLQFTSGEYEGDIVLCATDIYNDEDKFCKNHLQIIDSEAEEI